VRLLGIYREQIYSPGKVRDDAAILDSTLLELSRRGYQAEARPAEALEDLFHPPPIVLSMAQSTRALRILEEWHRRGARIVNSVASVRNCYRQKLIPLLTASGAPVPASQMISPEKEPLLSPPIRPPCWLKRGDVHAMEEGDVVKVESAVELGGALAHFRSRGIEHILVQEHVPGEVIKFYGVGRGDFFQAFPSPRDEGGAPARGALFQLSGRAAGAAGLEIYGGDAILTPEGRVVLIDLNDWPSFSRCCQTAAAAIAQYITRIENGGFHERANGYSR
jgi:glutathione synthase/RimK-type ligase-like ATP-grasp enzyme